MRVAQLLRKYDPTEWGGTESAIHQLTAGLAAHGVESVVYAPWIPDVNRGEARFRSHRGSDATHPAPRREDWDPLATAGRTVRRFHACVPVWGIPSERKRQLIAVGGNAISFDLPGALWSERNLEVVHSHALGRLGAIGRVVARSRRLPFVLSVHGGVYDLPAAVTERLLRPASGGWDWGRPLGLLLRARHLLAEADAVVTFNPREAALIRERHPRQRVICESHGVAAAAFAQDNRAAAQRAFPALHGRWVLLVLGRIDAAKNQEWLLAQLAELARRHPKICLVLVGACTDRDYGDALQARIAREGLQAFVLLAGSLPAGDARLVGLLQMAWALILPSVSETFGIVILEAWAAGTPVISSRTSGATSLVQEGVNGLLFDLARPTTFHAAVNQVLGRPALGRALGAAGRAKVIAEFDTSVLAGRMKRLYEELIGEKNALRHSARR
jgi:glycosyltransferase involved in cell wall biosynthesis